MPKSSALTTRTRVCISEPKLLREQDRLAQPVVSMLGWWRPRLRPSEPLQSEMKARRVERGHGNVAIAVENCSPLGVTPAGCERGQVEDTWPQASHLPIYRGNPMASNDYVRCIELAVDECHWQFNQHLNDTFVARE